MLLGHDTHFKRVVCNLLFGLDLYPVHLRTCVIWNYTPTKFKIELFCDDINIIYFSFIKCIGREKTQRRTQKITVSISSGKTLKFWFMFNKCCRRNLNLKSFMFQSDVSQSMMRIVSAHFVLFSALSTYWILHIFFLYEFAYILPKKNRFEL